MLLKIYCDKFHFNHKPHLKMVNFYNSAEYRFSIHHEKVRLNSLNFMQILFSSGSDNVLAHTSSSNITVSQS